MENWIRWKNKNRQYYQNQSEKKRLELKHKHFTDQILINQVFVDFDIWIDNIPKEIDYTVGKWTIKRKNKKYSRLEKRIQSMYQCYTCGSTMCRDGRCRNYKEAICGLADEMGIDKNDKEEMKKLKPLMGRFCHICGKTGGHQRKDEKCVSKCK